jgi:hypothetical protein
MNNYMLSNYTHAYIFSQDSEAYAVLLSQIAPPQFGIDESPLRVCI